LIVAQQEPDVAVTPFGQLACSSRFEIIGLFDTGWDWLKIGGMGAWRVFLASVV
jgi:hypothetical protein